jgi:uncharacterized protein YndB with AHSA1/START domain
MTRSDAMVEIDNKARVVGSSEIEVSATPELVWAVLTDIGRWPSWNPAVASVSFEEGFEEGSQFRWKAGPGTITSTIRDVDAPRRTAWTGTSLGIQAIHVHTLEPRSGGTLVRTEESYAGLLASILRGPLRRMLDRTLQGELEHLKAEAERQDRQA